MKQQVTGDVPLGQSTVILLLSRYGVSAINLGASVYLLRVLPIEAVAATGLLDIMISLFGFVDLGLTSALLRKAPPGLNGRGSLQESISIIRLVTLANALGLLLLGVFASLMAGTIGRLFLKAGNYAWIVYILVPGAVLTVLFQSLQGSAQAAQRFKTIAAWCFWAALSRQVLSVAGYHVGGIGGYLVGLTIASIVPVAGMVWSLRDLLFNAVRPAPFWPLLRYSLPFNLRAVLRFGFMQFDQLVVGALLPPSALATFSVAKRFASQLGTLSNSLSDPIMIRAASTRTDAAETRGQFARKALRVGMFIVLPACFLTAAVSPWLMRIYGGPKYAAGWPILALLCVAQAACAVYQLRSTFVFALLPPSATVLADASVGLVNYVIAPVLVLVVGQCGVVWGQLVGFTVGIAVIRRLLRDFPEVPMDMGVLRVLAIPSVLYGIVVVTGQWLWPELWIVPGYIGLGLVLFAAALLPRLRADDWTQFRNLAPRRCVRPLDWVQEFAGKNLSLAGKREIP